MTRLTVVPDPDDEQTARKRQEAGQVFDMATETLMIAVQVWVMSPTPANKNHATAALATQLRAWQTLNDAMP